MNWEKIKETKAYEEWIDFYPYNWDEFTLKEAYPFENLIGWLFRFFDERGILVDVETHSVDIVTTDFKDISNVLWEWDVWADGIGIVSYDEERDYPDRPSALKEGFEKAFNILNDNIKNAQ